MLPTGHIEYTWAALNLLQRRAGLFRDADYRWMALAAIAPDLLDKPLALTLYRNESAALFWGHNLWLHAIVWAVVLAGTRCAPAFTQSSLHRLGRVRRSKGLPSSLRARPSTSRLDEGPPAKQSLYRALPYLLAFSGHLVADRMWGFQESLVYPLGAGRWHPWVHVGEPAAMLGAYFDIVRTTPILLFFELSGLALLGWFIADRKLWQRARLARFLRRGRVDALDEAARLEIHRNDLASEAA